MDSDYNERCRAVIKDLANNPPMWVVNEACDLLTEGNDFRKRPAIAKKLQIALDEYVAKCYGCGG